MLTHAWIMLACLGIEVYSIIVWFWDLEHVIPHFVAVDGRPGVRLS